VTAVTSRREALWPKSSVEAGPLITVLMQKLIDIEKSIGVETDRTILDKVLDAESCLLQFQREMIASRHGDQDGTSSNPTQEPSAAEHVGRSVQ
jgi:hypothetical protein